METLRTEIVLDFLRQHWRRVLLWAVLGAAIGFAISYVIPPTYRATAVILPPEEDELTAALSLSRRSLGNLGALGKIGSYFTQADVALAILRSRTVHENVVRDLELETVYHSKNIEEAVRVLGKKVRVRISSDGSIAVSAEDKTSERAAAIANAFMSELDSYNQQFRSFRGRRIRQFLESRLAECDSTLHQVENRLAAYQEEEGTILLPPDAGGVGSGASALLGQVVAAEVQLELLRSFSSPTSEEVMRQEALVNQLRRQIGSLPATQTAGARLLREWAVQQQLFALLTAQLEQARIREAMDTPTIEILDRAVPPYRRAWPRRAWVALFGFVVGLILGVTDARGGIPRPFGSSAEPS